MTYGLTATGFVPKTYEIVLAEIFASWRSVLGNSIATHAKSVLGQLGAIFAAMIAELWEVAEQIYNSQDPDAATGAGLDSLSALTGTVREAASPSTVTLTMTGTDGTTVPTGSRARTTNHEFETIEDGEIVLLDSWSSTTGFSIGQRRTNSDRCYECIADGTSAGSGGPTTTEEDITDGTVHWRYLGEGDSAGDADAQSVLTGPITADSGDIDEIVTPVSGWRSVINLLDAELGENIETDSLLRLRRQVELFQPGATIPDAIRAAILALDGVVSCTVFYNDTDFTDSDNVPPHAVEPLVRGGDDQEIIDAIGNNIAGGIATFGNTSGTFVDSEGVSHTINFSRPDEVEIYVDVVGLVYNASTFPSDGQDQIKTKIVEWGDAQATGKNAVSSAILAQIHKVTGVLDAGLPEIGTGPSPTLTTTVSITNRQLAVYDTSRITIVAPTTGTP